MPYLDRNCQFYRYLYAFASYTCWFGSNHAAVRFKWKHQLLCILWDVDVFTPTSVNASRNLEVRPQGPTGGSGILCEKDNDEGIHETIKIRRIGKDFSW